MPRPSWLLLLLSLLPFRLGAQGLPAFAPINPVAESRSGLSFEPYHAPRPGGWSSTLSLDYASTIEFNVFSNRSFILDSELLRFRLGVTRDLSRRIFLLADAKALGAYDGFMDGFLDWYHGLLGIRISERDKRPHDQFRFTIDRAGRSGIQHGAEDLFLGDMRVGVGARISPALQSVFAITLPTSTGPPGYGRGVLSINLLNTLHLPVTERLLYEGGFGAGYTREHGALADAQRELFVTVSSGLRFRVWGRQWLYGNMLYHSPYYEGTGFPALDHRDLAFDFGWALATGPDSEWRIGMTEDLEPRGPAIDLIFRLARRF